jgi:hypothetical protein
LSAPTFDPSQDPAQLALVQHTACQLTYSEVSKERASFIFKCSQVL